MEKTAGADLFFDISLAQWSYNRAIRRGDLDHLGFAAKAKSLGIDAIEYVSQFFEDKVNDTAYLNEMNSRADSEGVKQLLIMVDGEGDLGDLNDNVRQKAIENHYKWVNAAKVLGCHSIRVNAHGKGSYEDVAAAAVAGLGALSEYAAQEDINILVENHGGYTSSGKWLSEVMSQIDKTNCGTLPDFGNFCQTIGYGSINDPNCKDPYDIYQGLDELMPFAKAVSAKSYNFDNDGNQPVINYEKMMKIVKDHGYTGYVGIEYEGRAMPEENGVKATRDLLIKVGKKLS